MNKAINKEVKQIRQRIKNIMFIAKLQNINDRKKSFIRDKRLMNS